MENWISAEDCLPIPYDDVEVLLYNGKTKKDFYEDDGTGHYKWSHTAKSDVEAWRPLKNTYLIGVCPWFQREETFEVTAETKMEAFEKARVKVDGTFYNPATLRIIKKVNKKRGKQK